MKNHEIFVHLMIAAALGAAPLLTAADTPMMPASENHTAQPTPPSTAKPVAPANPAPVLRFNMPPPALDVTDLDGKPVKLADFLGQPVVLQFGSITEPIFRMHAARMAQIVHQFQSKVKFVLIYTAESHAADGPDALPLNTDEGFGLAAPTTQDERIKLAHMAQDRLNFTGQTVLVDAWNDTTYKRYGRRPNMTFLLDAKGNLAAAYPWLDTNKLNGAIADVLVGRAVTAAHQGPVRMDVTVDPAARQPVGDGGLAGVALTLDAMTLTDQQKIAILPAVAEYFAGLRNVREKIQGKPAQAGQAAQAAQPGQPAVPAEDPAAVLADARASAAKLRSVLEVNLSKPDYQKVMDALTAAPVAGRLFTQDPAIK